MIRVSIVEDDAAAAGRLKDYIRRYSGEKGDGRII